MSKEPKLIIMPNIQKFGELVMEHLKVIRDDSLDKRIDIHLDRFANAEGKATLCDDVVGKKIFILSDVGNYGEESCYYSRGRVYMKSPDDHFQDIKRVISAVDGRAKSIHVVTPLLYESRQDKKPNDVYESLDCQEGLIDLEMRNVNGIITMDAHNPVACQNSLRKTTFDNLLPTYILLREYLLSEEFQRDRTIVVAPDKGAVSRAISFASALGVDVGMFHKRRDYSQVINGKNPLVEHKYLGEDVWGKNVIIVDDMIASGESVLDVAAKLKMKGAKRIDIMETFPLFTDGEESIKRFESAYEGGIINTLYTTNVTYVPEDVKSERWYHEVDLSNYFARVINAVSNEQSLRQIDDLEKDNIKKLIKK
ncbi:MAG: ribose-phosphate diphosphokinase [Bacilli bacterium]|nr:ribose-phosphate diphosphokinase [Bacilli bacterium]